MRVYAIFILTIFTIGAKADYITNKFIENLTSFNDLNNETERCSNQGFDKPDVIADPQDPSQLYKTVKLDTSSSGKTKLHNGDEISVLSKEQAEKLFKEFEKISYIPYEYVDDGCYNRAQEFALIAQRYGIKMGKKFLEHSDNVIEEDFSNYTGAGVPDFSSMDTIHLLYPKRFQDKENKPFMNGFQGWKYHVAPYLLVESNGKIEPYIFDVGTSTQIQTEEDWAKGLMSDANKAKITTTPKNYMDKDGFEQTNKSTISREIERLKLIEEYGESEYQYMLSRGWL